MNATASAPAAPRRRAKAADFLTGDVVTARPWAKGSETATARRALVVESYRDSGAVLVWFYTVGAPAAPECGSEKIGSLQMMAAGELTMAAPIGYADASLDQLGRWYRQINRAASERPQLVALLGKIARRRRRAVARQGRRH